jgi:hypothetical protein
MISTVAQQISSAEPVQEARRRQTTENFSALRFSTAGRRRPNRSAPNVIELDNMTPDMTFLGVEMDPELN